MEWSKYLLANGAGGWKIEPPNKQAQLLFVGGISDGSDRVLPALSTFADASFAIQTLDLRGFAESKGEIPGHFGDNSGAENILNDIAELTSKFSETKIPLLVIGHSTGAIFMHHAISQFGLRPNKLVLSAPAGPPNWESRIARLLFSLQKLKHGKRGHSPFIEQQTTLKYQQAVTAEVKHGWRTTEHGLLDEMQGHPDVNQPASVQSWLDILKILNRNGPNIPMPEDLPCLLLSGGHDASNHFGAGTFKLAQQLTQQGLICQHHFLPLARHDIWAGEIGLQSSEIVRKFWNTSGNFR